MSRFLECLNERGYTLFESIFQLIIFAMFAQLVVLFFLWKVPIERNYSQMSNSEWELFAVDLQKELIGVYEFEVYLDGRGIRLLNDRGRIDVDFGNAVIRKKINGVGHIPFLTAVQNASFKNVGPSV